MYKSTLIIFTIIAVISSCNHYDELQKNAKESMAGDDESHNAGQNCMSCHNKGGFNEAVQDGGWWNIAGTAFNGANYAKDGSVELWTEANRTGTLIYKLSIDDLGNFYTGKIVNFRGGAFPVLIDKNGNIKKAMQSSTVNGSCNSCHGINTPVISFN